MGHMILLQVVQTPVPARIATTLDGTCPSDPVDVRRNKMLSRLLSGGVFVAAPDLVATTDRLSLPVRSRLGGFGPNTVVAAVRRQSLYVTQYSELGIDGVSAVDGDGFPFLVGERVDTNPVRRVVYDFVLSELLSRFRSSSFWRDCQGRYRMDLVFYRRSPEHSVWLERSSRHIRIPMLRRIRLGRDGRRVIVPRRRRLVARWRS
jgi:hypothetical protein